MKRVVLWMYRICVLPFAIFVFLLMVLFEIVSRLLIVTGKLVHEHISGVLKDTLDCFDKGESLLKKWTMRSILC